MPTTVHVNQSWLIVAIIADAFAILYPVVLAIIAHQRLRVGWKYFGFGALIFFLFQVISRVPLVTWLGIVLAPQLKASPVFLYIWLAILALSAGLFEEVGRYVGYRWLMRREEKTTVSIIVELIVAAFGLAGIWVIWRLRDKPEAALAVSGFPRLKKNGSRR